MSTMFVIESLGQSEKFLVENLYERGFVLMQKEGAKMFYYEGAGYIHYHGLSNGIFTFERFGANDPEPITWAIEEILEAMSLTEHDEGYWELVGEAKD